MLGRRFFSHMPPKRPGSGIQWYPIPVGLGVACVGLVQFYKVYTREKEERQIGDGENTRPKKRQRIRPDGPW